MPWQRLTLRLDAAELARTEALLRLIGASAISISDDDGPAILEPAPGTTPLWPKLKLQALFADDLDLSGIASIVEQADGGAGPSIDTVTDADWQTGWQESLEPVSIGPRLSIVPAERIGAEPDAVGLHMGLAFGTGRHPTTELCLRWIDRQMPAGVDVLDYGSGTGILGLASRKLGARRIYAVDNDPQALTATERNVRLNRCEDAFWIGRPGMLPHRPVDIVLANILAQPLIDLAAFFAGRQTRGGSIVLSGILVSQLDEVEHRYSRYYDQLSRESLGEWGLLSGRRKHTDPGAGPE